jgi:Tfp pilus assembly protein PilN
VTTTAERVSELYRVGREQQTKFTYFLLAGVAAAIAFAVQITNGEAFRWQHYILGVAVAAWLLSFLAGIKYLQSGMAVTEANQVWLQFRQEVQTGEIPNIPAATAVHDDIESRMRRLSDRSGRWGKWQVRLFYLGALAFIAWHILRMENNPLVS